MPDFPLLIGTTSGLGSQQPQPFMLIVTQWLWSIVVKSLLVNCEPWPERRAKMTRQQHACNGRQCAGGFVTPA